MEKLSKDIELLNEKERKSEGIIVNLQNFDSMIKQKDEKIEKLEGKLKDTNLKILEQNNEIEIINKKLRVLNPIKPNVFRSVKNPGGGAKRHPLEINKGAP